APPASRVRLRGAQKRHPLETSLRDSTGGLDRVILAPWRGWVLCRAEYCATFACVLPERRCIPSVLPTLHRAVCRVRPALRPASKGAVWPGTRRQALADAW